MVNDGIAFTANPVQAVSSAGGAGNAPAARTVAAAAPVSRAPAAVEIDLADLREQLAAVNQMLKEQRSSLAFSVDEGTGKTVVRVVRQSTGEVIRQIPSEEALAIASSLKQTGALSSLGVETWS